ncbi:MAG TPA: hypothetical protein VEC35_01140 [Noviherbaspirillum sp.]|nr:hypothetical protein [Noviherbaspirillum sp.]
MSARFEVGEIAIVQNTAGSLRYLENTECEVIEHVNHPIYIDGVAHIYRVACEDGREYLAGAHQLRKKYPPQSDLEWAVLKVISVVKPVIQPELEPA